MSAGFWKFLRQFLWYSTRALDISHAFFMYPNASTGEGVARGLSTPSWKAQKHPGMSSGMVPYRMQVPKYT
jgi:hypothetical protein